LIQIRNLKVNFKKFGEDAQSAFCVYLMTFLQITHTTTFIDRKYRCG